MDKIEKFILDTIDSHKDEIINFGRDIWFHAETGYVEYRTAEKFAEALERLGLGTDREVAVTGVKSRINNGDGGITVCLMGEMDALPIPGAPHSNPETGAAHCCGHHAQLTGVMGAAFALTLPEVREALGGDLVLFGCPAEEGLDTAVKKKLTNEGKIQYMGGKCELIRLDALGDIDIVVGHHSDFFEVSTNNASMNGFVEKTVTFTGRAAHAAGMPEKGIDALAAAGLAMHALDLQRESFRDGDNVRVHGRMVKGGEAANIICDECVMQYLVRANNLAAIEDASYKFDRAMKAGAVATGCGLTIETAPGYMPLIPAAPEDMAVIDRALNTAAVGYRRNPDDMKPSHMTGSSDYGDISLIMPLMQFSTGGVTGQVHSPTFDMSDEYLAYVVTAKIFALSAYYLLKDGAAEAKRIKADFRPALTRGEYLERKAGQTDTFVMDMAPAPGQMV